ncbi:hypothetical protein [Maribacter sp. Asnod1-A12]|uniref:hypothetical protein n=1 Tax=Maribacter sp. Asnod1-A12 TaxID=3160576 RepID=UPI003863317E
MRENDAIKMKIIAGMIQSSMVNNGLEQIEYEFICSIGDQLGLNHTIIDEYIKEEEIFILPSSLACKVIRFYKMAMKDKCERKCYFKWVRLLYKRGLTMGLPQDVIKKFLYDLHFCEDYYQGERLIKSFLSK